MKSLLRKLYRKKSIFVYSAMLRPAKYLPVCLLLVILMSCTHNGAKDNIADDKEQLLSLEYKWLAAEFALDTAFLSSIIDTTFAGISETGVQDKQEALLDMYSNISQRLKDSIVIDSFKLENTLVNVYGNTAVVTLIVHTHGKNKSNTTERRTRFYDVWIKREGKWKAVASQGTKVE